MVERLFLVPCLVSPAWHLCLKVSKVCGSDVRGITGGPKDGREFVPRPPSGQPSLAPLPQGEQGSYVRGISQEYFTVSGEYADRHKIEPISANFRAKPKKFQIVNPHSIHDRIGQKTISRYCAF